MASSSSDEAIQLTNNDASTFKAYAVSKGYWNDPYISYFSSSSSASKQGIPVEHKPPEMSRGYFARVNAIRSVIHRFLENNDPNMCQIVNLGAGYDTLFFDLLEKKRLPRKYVEIDFQRIVMSKIRIIKSKRALTELTLKNIKQDEQKSSNESDGFKIPAPMGPPSSMGPPLSLPAVPSNQLSKFTSELHTLNYDLISVDLRNINELEKKLTECYLDRTLPTLFIAECVLIYMNSTHSNSLLKYLSQNYEKCCFLNYEQCNLNDRFGEIMLSNMQARACELLGVEACSSIDTQYNRFVSSGFNSNTCQIITMTDYYKNKLDSSERYRIESIEFLDENELLMQLMDHYCICIAANNTQLKYMLF